MKTEKVNTDQLEILKNDLRKWMPKGSTVYTILRSVSRSGMMRVISPVVLELRYEPVLGENGEPMVDPIFPEYKVAQLLGYTLDKNQGIKISGAGMDMGFHLIYTLSQAMYGDGYALKQRWL